MFAACAYDKPAHINASRAHNSVQILCVSKYCSHQKMNIGRFILWQFLPAYDAEAFLSDSTFFIALEFLVALNFLVAAIFVHTK